MMSPVDNSEKLHRRMALEEAGAATLQHSPMPLSAIEERLSGVRSVEITEITSLPGNWMFSSRGFDFFSEMCLFPLRALFSKNYVTFPTTLVFSWSSGWQFNRLTVSGHFWGRFLGHFYSIELGMKLQK